jgi:hypothetical protein
MNITPTMVEAMMKEMDNQLLNRNGNNNIWKDACEIARYGIALKLLEVATKEVKKEVT